MEAGSSSLVVRMKTEMIDSSCKSHITGSKGLPSRNASNHTERSQHPQVPQPLNPCLNYVCEMTDFPGNFSKHPNCCHTHMSWACACVCAYSRVCFCLKMCASVCDWMCELRTCKSESWFKCIRRWHEYIFANHTWLSEQILRTEGETLTSVTAAHQKVPKQGTWSLGGPPKSAPCHLLCVSLTFCLSYTNVFSPRLPAQPLLLLPFFLGGRRSDIY